MRKVIVCCLILLLPLFFMAGCFEAPNLQNTAGTYVGKYFGGVETFTLKADGTFTQVFRQKGAVVYSNTGTWSISKNELSFEPFIYFSKDRMGTISHKEANRMSCYGAPVLGDQIIFSENDDYWINKQ